MIAFIVVFLFFLQLRIADEFKDYDDDLRYRSYRPVPRGLVTLRELGIVAIGSVVIQLGLTFSLGRFLLLSFLGLVWSYMSLMAKEFFVPDWLKKHSLVYLLSHGLILPLIAFYATACDWLIIEGAMAPGTLWFLLVSFLGGITLELGRKIRAPKDEERGVETYTVLWGRQKAVMAWLCAIWLLTVSTLIAAMHIRFTVPIALLLLLLLTASVVVAWRFLSRPTRTWAKWFEPLSGVWNLLVYAGIGLLPLLL